MASETGNIPRTRRDWQSLVKSMDLEDASLHDGSYTNSASEITLPQFLLLRVIWPKRAFASAFEAGDYLDPKYIEEAKLHLRHGGTGWNEYLTSIQNSPTRVSYPKQFLPLGGYCCVRDLQLALFGVANQPALPPQAKVDFSPPKTRARSAALAKVNKATDEATSSGTGTRVPPQSMPQPPPQPPTTPDKRSNKRPRLASQLSEDEIDPQGDEALAGMIASVELSPHSPAKEDLFPPVSDEQLVNMSLILFLRTLMVHCNVKGEWSPVRRPFIVRSGDLGAKIYEAQVDGYLRRGHNNVRNNVRAIVEAKPCLRYPNKSAAGSIKMQESAQMAAWIYEDPPAELDACRRGNKPITRLLVSQDRHEIYLTFATFDDAYVDFIQGKQLVPEFSFLEMREFGPFSVDNRNQMQILGETLLAFTMQQCQDG